MSTGEGHKAVDVVAVLDRVKRFRPPDGLFIVGVTGSVASGKSRLAQALALAFATLGAKAEIVSTDGFLFSNATLEERGLTLRKGFPESYDLEALARTLSGVRRGPVRVPIYSHVIYDVEPGAGALVEPADILIIEGLALGLDRAVAQPAAPLIDCLIYIDAEETDLETWFTARFMTLWEAAADDPSSFYARFLPLGRDGAAAVARQVWSAINLVNLRANIAPMRQYADLVVRKGPDHAVLAVAP